MHLINTLLSKISLFFFTFYIFLIFGSFLKGGEPASTGSAAGALLIVLFFYYLSLAWVEKDKKRLIPFPPRGDLNISISLFAAMFGIYRGMTLGLF